MQVTGSMQIVRKFAVFPLRLKERREKENHEKEYMNTKTKKRERAQKEEEKRICETSTAVIIPNDIPVVEPVEEHCKNHSNFVALM